MKRESVKELVSLFNTCLELDENGNEPTQNETDIASILSIVLTGEGYCPFCGIYSEQKSKDLFHCPSCNNILGL